MSKTGRDLLESLSEALVHAKGEASEATLHSVDLPDVRAIRRRLHMSQNEFAAAFQIPLPTLKNWEQGRRVPDAPAAAYLRVIARMPEQARAALR